MPRPPRPQFAGAIYHVNTRGNRRAAIYRGDHDRVLFLSRLLHVIDRFEWECHAWCLLTTHYHLLVTTPHPNIARGMQELNSRYAEAFNGQYALTGHVFQGRYHHKLAESEEQLLEQYRYVALQPVRAQICERPTEWPWSSYSGLVAGWQGRLYQPPALLANFEGGLRGLSAFVETPEPVSASRTLARARSFS
ncbi:MAG TPA: transposase [Gaiellaceae bacterium]|jgi:REP element-mobilizing transposase RayT|nr:transposase [Gaiellaceae bacterium]